jgi:hypothetical protein
MFPFPVELQPVWVYQAEAIAALAAVVVGDDALDYMVVVVVVVVWKHIRPGLRAQDNGGVLR